MLQPGGFPRAGTAPLTQGSRGKGGSLAWGAAPQPAREGRAGGSSLHPPQLCPPCPELQRKVEHGSDSWPGLDGATPPLSSYSPQPRFRIKPKPISPFFRVKMGKTTTMPPTLLLRSAMLCRAPSRGGLGAARFWAGRCCLMVSPGKGSGELQGFPPTAIRSS